MFGHNFYYGLTRKYIIYFGTLFNDIVVDRTNDQGDVVQSVGVPLSYAHKDKMLARLKQDPNLDKQSALTVPRISFWCSNFQYDSNRHLNSMHRIVRKDSTNPNRFRYNYSAVPYNLDFELYIYVNANEDATKILEQILPFFTPEWEATVHLIPEMDITQDIPIVLNSVTTNDNFEGDFANRRILTYTLSFTLKGWYYGPIKKSKIIKFANTQFYFGENSADTTVSDIVSEVVVTPGLLANGSPTSNSSASISPLLIDIEDDWAFAVTPSGLVLVEDQ